MLFRSSVVRCRTGTDGRSEGPTGLRHMEIGRYVLWSALMSDKGFMCGTKGRSSGHEDAQGDRSY